MSATIVVRRQIADGAIDDTKVGAGANIATSKLADALNFMKRASAGNPHDALNERIANVANAINNNEAVNLLQLTTAIANLASVYKYKDAKCAATTNVVINNPVSAVFDTITAANGDRVLLPNQTAPAENGIYTFNGVGVAMTRVADMDAWSEFPGTLVTVSEGSTYDNARLYCNNSTGGTLGTTAIVFTRDVTDGLRASNFVDKEIPSGAINGVNATFTLANTPTSGSEHVFLNGILQEAGAGNDYTLSGAVITMLAAPLTGEKIRVTYRK